MYNKGSLLNPSEQLLLLVTLKIAFNAFSGLSISRLDVDSTSSLSRFTVLLNFSDK